MTHVILAGRPFVFLLLAILAGFVIGAAAARQGLGQQQSLSIGAAVLLAQVGVCIGLVGLGAPPVVAQGAALGLGVMATAMATSPAWPPLLRNLAGDRQG
ncbi:hypothetical protein [Siccirubricoccus sp. G192]|uniref:hypothetical protein n=1 Tax=Siccirubricoccus sp. G192 TaxID=2849651 RepID=UPI001C2CBB14|nr:hypothetical protein [Siccirubricoccus sp. G192]MBV1798819.1 hypothetical protein [Siccirubricoccus sp. G192]